MSLNPITLQELLRLALDIPVEWLCKAEEIPEFVEWVALNLTEAQQGDLLLLQPNELEPSLIQKAYEKGVAALLILGKPNNPNEIEVCPLPIGWINPERPIHKREIQKLLLAVLINARAAVVERGARIHAQLAQLEAEGKGLEGLVKTMAEITARGVILLDKRGVVLAHHPSSTLGAIWNDIISQLGELRNFPEPLLD
ncbi:MAG: hypothetical protein ACPL7A_03580, partial [Anaerolineales bacterium]